MKISWCSGLLFVAAGAILPSCQSGDAEVGLSVINPYILEVKSMDSVTIQTSTILSQDSLITSTDSSIVVGHWTDTYMGRMTAKGFMSVDFAAHELTNQSTLRPDSLVLELGYSFTYGDTTALTQFKLHQLSGPLNSEQTYYSGNSAAYVFEPLSQSRVSPRPNSGNRQLRFKLSDELAEAFYQKLVRNEIYDNATMVDFWKGFALTGSPVANLLVGFYATSGASGLRLYYHSTDIDRTVSSVQFPVESVHFTQLINDRTGTALAALNQRTDAVSSTLTGNTTFIGLGARLRTRIELPYLGVFDKPEQYVGLNKALLVIEPVRQSTRDNAPPPTQLALYQLNSQNEVIATVPAFEDGSADALAVYSVNTASLELTDAYTFDVTQYVTQIIKKQVTNRPLLLTVPYTESGLRSMLRRVTLGDQMNGTSATGDRIKLMLFVTTGI